MHPFYVNVNMKNGQVMNNWIDSLQASHAGVQVLEGDLDEAICFHALYFSVWKKFGIMPERYNWHLKLPDVYFYPLRPELAESTYFLYRATRNPFYLHAAKQILNNIEQISKVKCGYATVHDVLDKSLEDRMESFFIAETLKYLYLTFDTDNHLNQKGETKYVFTTEGHLFPIRNEFKTKRNVKRRKGKALSSRNQSRKSCLLNKSQNSYLKLKSNLPMNIKQFDQVFDMVGVHDNIESLLDRKSA